MLCELVECVDMVFVCVFDGCVVGDVVFGEYGLFFGGVNVCCL